MKRKTILAVVALSALSFNAEAWQINNGWCQQLSIDGQVLVMVKANRAAIVGQIKCDEAYFGKGESIGVNGEIYPTIGTCNQNTGFKPISVADSPVQASAIAEAISLTNEGMVQAFGGYMPITRGNFNQVCSAVIPSLKSVSGNTAVVDMNIVKRAAVAIYEKTYGEIVQSADFETVNEMSPVQHGSETLRVFQYEVFNPLYRQNDNVVVYVSPNGEIVDTQLEYQGR